MTKRNPTTICLMKLIEMLLQSKRKSKGKSYRRASGPIEEEMSLLQCMQLVRTHTLGGVPVESLTDAQINLLKNALEFSPAGGEVLVRAESDSGMVRLLVRDQGAGLPDYAAERAFERFFSLPRPDGRKGSGLGLAICHNLVQEMGGRMELVSAPGKGSSFSVSIPLEPLEEGEMTQSGRHFSKIQPPCLACFFIWLTRTPFRIQTSSV